LKDDRTALKNILKDGYSVEEVLEMMNASL